MRRRNTGLLLLLVAFVGMALLVTMQDQGGVGLATPVVPTAPPATPVPELFPGVTAEAIAAVRLQDPNTDRRLTLSRDADGRWFSSEYEGQPIDQGTARDIVRTLVIMPVLRTFDLPESTDLTQYGFLPTGAFFFVQFVTVDGAEHFIVVGNPADDDPLVTVPAFYALVDDRPAMYLLRQDALFWLAQHLDNPPLE